MGIVGAASPPQAQTHAEADIKFADCRDMTSRFLLIPPYPPSEAERAFGKHPENLSEADKLAFGDYIFHKICEFAIEFDLPFQNHTGLGIISGSNPMNLEPVIARYPP